MGLVTTDYKMFRRIGYVWWLVKQSSRSHALPHAVMWNCSVIGLKGMCYKTCDLESEFTKECLPLNSTDSSLH